MKWHYGATGLTLEVPKINSLSTKKKNHRKTVIFQVTTIGLDTDVRFLGCFGAPSGKSFQACRRVLSPKRRQLFAKRLA